MCLHKCMKCMVIIVHFQLLSSFLYIFVYQIAHKEKKDILLNYSSTFLPSSSGRVRESKIKNPFLGRQQPYLLTVIGKESSNVPFFPRACAGGGQGMVRGLRRLGYDRPPHVLILKPILFSFLHPSPLSLSRLGYFKMIRSHYK